jgi:hypothetical protein
MEKQNNNQREQFIQFLKNSDLEYDEWNDLMLTLDSGYIEVIFNSLGEIVDIRARVE